MRSSGLTAPLRMPAFRRLAASYAVNELGDWMGLIALSVLVYDQTGSAIATAALFMGTGFVPALLSPLIATRAERWPPRLSLPVIYCGEAVAFAALALIAEQTPLVVVIAIAAIDAALGIASRSLTRAVVATILKPSDELRAGNAVLNVAFTGGAAAGPMLAGLVVAGLGAETALALNAVSFFVIAVLLFGAGSLPRAEPEPGRLRDQLRAGIVYVRGNQTLRRLLLAQSGAFIFFAAVLPIEVIYVKETLGAGDAGYGLMLGCWGVGMLIGGILFARLRRTSIPHLLFWSTSTIAFGYLCLAVAPTLALACAASVVGGAGNGVQWVSTINAVQELTAASMQTRVMSILESANAAMPGVGFALGGAIAALSGPRTTFLVASLGIFAIVVVSVFRLGSNWPERIRMSSSDELDAGDEVVLELLPGRRAVQSYSEVKP